MPCATEEIFAPLRVHWLQHVPFEGLGYIEWWLGYHRTAVTVTSFFSDWRLPSIEDVDLLIVMGGPMSANEERLHPWLAAEKAFLAKYFHSGKPVLGICLGAQLLAAALGAPVYANRRREIGWFPVYADPAARGSDFAFPSLLMAMHWHGETFDLPDASLRLAYSEACPVQAFSYGDAVVGLQCHLEATPDSIEQLIAHCGHELIDAPFVQGPSLLRGMDTAGFTRIHEQLSAIISRLFQRAHETRAAGCADTAAGGEFDRESFTALDQLPDIGVATARWLREIGIDHPRQLVGKNAGELFRLLCEKSGRPHDPSVIDILMATVHFMEGGAPRRWWTFSETRKVSAQEQKDGR